MVNTLRPVRLDLGKRINMATEKVLIELSQANLDRGHKIVNGLIDMLDNARIQSCNEGKVEARDVLDLMGAHARIIRSLAGSLDFGSGIVARAGDK